MIRIIYYVICSLSIITISSEKKDKTNFKFDKIALLNSTIPYLI
jgi:hypothetical protein